MVLGLLFESARAMFFLFYSFKRASRSHAKTGFYSMVFSVSFFGAVSEEHFFVFLVFMRFLGFRGRSFLLHFLPQTCFFAKRWDIRFWRVS